MYANTGQFSRDAAATPPLHHPVPQYPIPPMRSPPNLDDKFATTNHRHQKNASNPYVPQNQQSHRQVQGGASYSSDPARAAFDSIASASQEYAYQQPGQQPGPAGPGFDLFSDPTAQIGLNVGRNAISYGQDYVSRHVRTIVPFHHLIY